MFRRISHSTAKTIIYGGAAAIVVVLVVLVATISSDGGEPAGEPADEPADEPAVRTPSAPAPPLIEDHAGVWASVYYVLKTDPSPERDGLYRISHGSECELFQR